MKKLVILIFAFALIFGLVNIKVNAASNNVSSDLQAQSDDEFGPLQIAISDLESISGLLDEGNKKVAVDITKSAKGQLRKISQLSKRMVKGMSARLDKAVKSIKKGDFSGALDEINHVLDELRSL